MMPNIELRSKPGERGPDDVVLTVQERTYDFLMESEVDEIRVSAYVDRDWPRVEASYAELFVDADCAYKSKVIRIMPGSKTRSGVTLPGPMKAGEQLTILVARTPA